MLFRPSLGLPTIVPFEAGERTKRTSREFPLHVVCSWLGNLPRIVLQSYLLVTEEGFARAAGATKLMVEG